MIERYSSFRCREVINICDGCRLGYVCDLEIDTDCGKILSLVIPGPCRFLGLFGREEDYVIPWPCIRRIGADIILVDVVPGNMKRPRIKKW
jgi:YlmC/YmxH family sporulation protein